MLYEPAQFEPLTDEPWDPVRIEDAIDHVRAGAEETGRDPDEVEIAVLCAMHVSDDQEEAWEQCRWAPAACANHIAYALKWNSQHGMPDEMTRIVAARDEYDYYGGHLDSAAEHAGYLTGDLVDDFAIAGPVERCLKKIRELGKLGVELHMGSLVTHVDPRGLDVEDHDGTVTRYEAGNVLWTAGVAAPPLADAVATATGAEQDRAGRLLCGPDLSLPGHPDILVTGDIDNADLIRCVVPLAAMPSVSASRPS